MTKEELNGKFKTLTAGQKTDSTINQMVGTFIGLCSYADWSEVEAAPRIDSPAEPVQSTEIPMEIPNQANEQHSTPTRRFDLNYDIHIHLPATRDQAVYDALFASLAKHIPLK